VTCKHIFNSDEGTSHCTLAGVTAEQWQAMKTELSQLRAERDGLLKWVDKEIAACLPGLPNHRLEDLQDFKSHLTRTEQKEGWRVDIEIKDDESQELRDNIKDTYYRIGKLLFERKDYSEINITCVNDIKVGITALYGEGHDILLQQKQADGKYSEILLNAWEDRNDAVRLAGLLLAWADTVSIHIGEIPKPSPSETGA